MTFDQLNAGDYWSRLEQLDAALTLNPVPNGRPRSAAEVAIGGIVEAPDCCIVTTSLAAVIVGVFALAETLDAPPVIDPAARFTYPHLLRQIEEVAGPISASERGGRLATSIAESTTNDATLEVIDVRRASQAESLLIDNTLFSLSIPWHAWEQIGAPLFVAEKLPRTARRPREYGVLFGTSDVVGAARTMALRLGFALDAGRHEQLRDEAAQLPRVVRAAGEEVATLAETLRRLRPDLMTRLPQDVMRGAGWKTASSGTVFVLYPEDASFEQELVLWQQIVDVARLDTSAAPAGSATNVSAFTPDGEYQGVTRYVRIQVGDDAAAVRRAAPAVMGQA